MTRQPRTLPPRRPLPPLVLALLLATAAGCDEPVPGSIERPAASASGQPVLTQSRPATPAPPAIATPVPQSPPPVATPLPQVVATVTPTPAPIAPSPGGSATPAPSASPGASPTASPVPSPSPSGPFGKTGAPGDLAISGPGYFVLATKPNPAGVEDLLFTRHGKFRLKAETIGSVPVFRLRHADHAFHVVGLQATGEPAVPPAETAAEDAVKLATTWGGQLVAAGLFLDADRNPQAQTQLAYDYTGKLQVDGAAPRGLDGAAAAAYVAIAQFDSPDRLVPAVGFPGIFRYETSALEPDEDATPGGLIHLGVAVSGVGRTVGNANLVLTGTLETL